MKNAETSFSQATSGFVLAAAITVVFNTVLAWAKDVYHPLNDVLTSIAGHQWTAHGCLDLFLFLALGTLFGRTGAAEKISPDRLIQVLIGAVVFAGLGLALWYVLI